MSNQLYDRMKARGIDMSWYEKTQGFKPDSKAPIPLHDTECGRLAIYFLNKVGKLFTVTGSGEPYMQVRITANKRGEDSYICLGCGVLFKTFKGAEDHYGKEATTTN